MSDGTFEAFVAEAATPLLRTAYLLTGGRRSAHDLLQTALIRTARRWPDIPATADATAAARHELVGAHAEWQGRLGVGELIADSPLLAGARGLPGFAQQPPDVGPRDELSVALGHLPPRLRAALVLHHGEGLPLPATADALGVPGEDVPGQLAEALARLGALMGGTAEDALVARLRRELPAHAADVVADPAAVLALTRDGARSQRRHLAGLLAVAGFVVLVVLLVALTV